jgi:hypothetical protein
MERVKESPEQSSSNYGFNAFLNKHKYYVTAEFKLKKWTHTNFMEKISPTLS